MSKRAERAAQKAYDAPLHKGEKAHKAAEKAYRDAAQRAFDKGDAIAGAEYDKEAGRHKESAAHSARINAEEQSKLPPKARKLKALVERESSKKVGDEGLVGRAQSEVYRKPTSFRPRKTPEDKPWKEEKARRDFFDAHSNAAYEEHPEVQGLREAGRKAREAGDENEAEAQFLKAQQKADEVVDKGWRSASVKKQTAPEDKMTKAAKTPLSPDKASKFASMIAKGTQEQFDPRRVERAKKQAMSPKSMQQGKRGGTFFIAASGNKVYLKR